MALSDSALQGLDAAWLTACLATFQVIADFEDRHAPVAAVQDLVRLTAFRAPGANVGVES
ncbi:MAG: hypothetical protein F4186_13090 [Boseongicola sp. SB0676_bin_33]|uniref:Uncharacterized protein n=1 Tax=Boseongicola sp. SB0664_bin_43 TaxID=2604844 RepID=A0A6B0XXJ8_9RHOB|nr:hypothetical protein [Boseongicola sp. SB0664_bin_43]MYF90169.1 hypothetical protein [Boseongicola sp. SB0676_bin_33]